MNDNTAFAITFSPGKKMDGKSVWSNAVVFRIILFAPAMTPCIISITLFTNSPSPSLPEGSFFTLPLIVRKWTTPFLRRFAEEYGIRPNFSASSSLDCAEIS
jgi:hypothetical protein